MTTEHPLRVVAVPGSGRARPGWFAPKSSYVETFWVPVVGPTSFLVWKTLAVRLDQATPALQTSLEEVAGAVGIGCTGGHQPKLVRALRRLQRFGLGWRPLESVLVIRCTLPVLEDRHVARLHPTLQRRHHLLGPLLTQWRTSADEGAECSGTPRQ